MARPKAVIPTVEKKIQIHADLCTRMELELFSDVEQKIPYGAQSNFINHLIREHYKKVDEAVNLVIHAKTQGRTWAEVLDGQEKTSLLPENSL